MSFSSRYSRDRTCASIIEYGLLGLIIFTPLPAASVYEWSILVIQLVVLIMASAYVIMSEKPQFNPYPARVVKRLKVIYFAFFIFIVIQWLPLPPSIIKIFSPETYNYQKLYTTDFSNMKLMSFSLIASRTLQQGLELLSCFLIAFLVLKTVSRRHQILRIWVILISMGVFEAFYGLFELYKKNPRILFYEKIHNLDSVTGTFVNRNHLSGYLEMIIPLAIGLLIARIHVFSQSSLTLREKLLKLQERGFTQNLLLFFSIIIMASAVVFSKSRSGLSILLFTFILFFGLITMYFKIHPFQRKWIKNSLRIIFLMIIVISFYFGINEALERFSLDNLLDEQRPAFWAHGLKMFLDYPLMGTGLGTFGALIPNIEVDSGPMAIVHAHNDYLEYLSELGFVGFSFLFGGIFYMGIVSFMNWRKRRNPEVKGLALGGIVSLICILTHSITDFNLHIPANMVLFSIVLSLTFVSIFYKRGDFQPGKK